MGSTSLRSSNIKVPARLLCMIGIVHAQYTIMETVAMARDCQNSIPVNQTPVIKTNAYQDNSLSCQKAS